MSSPTHQNQHNHNHQHNQHSQNQPPILKIPSFKPLPETTFINRLINKILAPFFYLIFTIITSIVVVPIYTIIQNFKNGSTKGRSSRRNKGGARVGRDYSAEERYGAGKSSGGPGKGEAFLDGWVNSYGKGGSAHSSARE